MNLTTTEARILYDWLRNQWAPKVAYGQYMHLMEKLEKGTQDNRETESHGTKKR